MRNVHLISSYKVDITHPLSKYKDEVIDLCEKFRARAYINLSSKSKRATAVQMLNNIADCFRRNNFQYLNRIWNSAAGQVGAIDKKWVIDCDFDEKFAEEAIPPMAKFINEECMPMGNKIVAYVRTKNGAHLITRPFDLRKFRGTYPLINIHKNNPTVLYIPKSIE